MRYPARFEAAEEGGVVISFRDIPEALTQGDTLEEAIDLAQDALVTAIEFYFEDERPIPAPSKAKKGEELIELPIVAQAKVLLLNEMLAQNVTPAEIARRLHTSPQSVNRLVKLGHPTKIETIGDALQTLGKRLEVQLEPA